MPYQAFDICRVTVGQVQQRGVKVTCNFCGTTDSIPMNTFANTRGDDDDIHEQQVRRKFEKLGWLIGKSSRHHKCPTCFSKIKIAAVARKNKQMDEPQKIVPIKPAVEATISPKPMGREEKRIIFEKLNEVYINENSGYQSGWNDQRVADEYKIPRAWVSSIREEMFGPDIDETTNAKLVEAKLVLADLQNALAALTSAAAAATKMQTELEKIITRK